MTTDFWALSVNDIPVALVKVNNPKATTDYLDIFYGEVFDGSMRIRSFHGVKDVFGILTDFETWKICWLLDSHQAAMATSLDYEKNDVDKDIYLTRSLFVSETYRRDNAQGLAHALYSFVKKLCYHSHMVESVAVLSRDRPFFVLKDNT